MRTVQCDVAVIGAGPAGLAAAVSLSRQGAETIVLERGDFEKRRIGEHLPPEIKPVLHRLGYPLHEIGKRHLESDGVTGCWVGGGEIGRDYVYSAHGPGLNITRPLFDRELAHLAEMAGSRVWTGVRIKLRSGSPNWKIDVVRADSFYCLNCQYIVDASGRQSWLSRKLGTKKRIAGSQLAAVAYIPMAEPVRDSRLTIEKRSSTWCYALPLQDRTRVIALLGPPDVVSPKALKKGTEWLTRFRETKLVSAPIEVNEPTGLMFCPAMAAAAREVCGEYWIAIGDAACAFDPLAGQGITKALQDGLNVADRVTAIGVFRTRDQSGYEKEIAERYDHHVKNLRRFRVVSN